MPEPPDLDNVDRGILRMLQQDARNNTASDIANEVGVAPNTVRNRIEQLKENGVINGYNPQIDYEQAGFQFRIIFICTTKISDRRNFADQALDIEGVIEVTEILSGQDNLVIEAVGAHSDDISQIAEKLEGLGLDVHDERLVKNNRTQPFDHFGKEVVEE